MSTFPFVNQFLPPVINELDGLARGAKETQQPQRQGASSPEEQAEHARLVQSQAQAAITFLEDEFESKNPNLRALTARGSVLETIAFRSEEAADNAVSRLKQAFCFREIHLRYSRGLV